MIRSHGVVKTFLGVVVLLTVWILPASDASAGDTVMVLTYDGKWYHVLHDAGAGFTRMGSFTGFYSMDRNYDWSDDGTYMGVWTDTGNRVRLVILGRNGFMKYSPVLQGGRTPAAIFHTVLPRFALAAFTGSRNAVVLIDKRTGSEYELYKLPKHFAYYGDMFCFDYLRNRLYYLAATPHNSTVSALYESNVLTGKTTAITIVPRGFIPRNAVVEPMTGAIACGVFGGGGYENLGVILSGQLILNHPVARISALASGPRDVTLRNYVFQPSTNPPSVMTIALQGGLAVKTNPILKSRGGVRAVGLMP